MALKLYPIGMQTFSEIREKDMLYVDKTEYVYRMSHGSGKFFFLSRPRRFGKSLLLSTMKSYFEGRKELFHGLAMERLETEWMEYPVPTSAWLEESTWTRILWNSLLATALKTRNFVLGLPNIRNITISAL